MPQSARMLVVGALASAAVVPGCAAENPVPKGDPIPGTDIVSCGDVLIGAAAPAGSITDSSLDASGSRTLLEGSIIWQASCPQDESDAQTQFVVERVTLYRDDAGFPGERLGSAAFDVRGTVSCADRSTTEIAGASKSQQFAPTEVADLSNLCAEHAAMPTGMPLFVHVELDGSATTCSAEEFPLLFRSKVGVACAM